MTDMNTNETPETPTDIDARLTRIEQAISDLRDMIEQPDQKSTDDTPHQTPVSPRNDRFEAARTFAGDAFAKAKDRARRAAQGAGLPLWAVVVIGVLAVIGVADLVDLDMLKVLDL